MKSHPAAPLNHFFGLTSSLNDPQARLGTPALTIVLSKTNTLIIAWPTPSTGYVLQERPDVAGGNWVNVAVPPQVVGGSNQVILPVSGDVPFYRLHLPETPVLYIGLTVPNSVVVTWAYPSAGFSLQANAGLDTANWAGVPTEPVQVGDAWQVTVSSPLGNMFYRLKK